MYQFQDQLAPDCRQGLVTLQKDGPWQLILLLLGCMLLGASRGRLSRWLLPPQLMFGGLQSNHMLAVQHMQYLRPENST